MGDRHNLVPITLSLGIGLGPKNIGLAQLNSVYHHWCNYEDEQIQKEKA